MIYFVTLTGNISTYTLVNIYAPNKRQPRFLKSLLKKVDQVKKGSLLLCGDFNCVANKSMDCSYPQSTQRLEIHHFLSEHNLYETWRGFHSSEKDFTHYSYPYWVYSRISLILSDFALLQKTLSVTIHSITW